MRRMSISLASLVVMLVAYTNYASPVKGIVGAVNEEFGDGQENPTPMYIKDGLVNFWDGLLSPRDYSSSDAVLGYWYDVLRGEALSGYVIDAPYILVGIAPNSYAWGATDSKIINSDFSIHTRLELPKRNIWKAWSIIGIGREDGLQDGIVLSGANQTLNDEGKLPYSLLLIDDEADNASINTRKPDYDPTATNEIIRQLCDVFMNSNYVGFTATPYANIFINPEKDDSKETSDLFPKDFIYVLPTPSAYIIL